MTQQPTDIRQRLRVPLTRLTTKVDEAALGFTSTREVAALEGTIGQDRALHALEFGLGVRSPGFNVYVAGAPGSGRNTTVDGFLRAEAARRPVPPDQVYVHNFVDGKRPRALTLPAGMGRGLAKDMEEMVVEARTRLPRAFESDDYQRRVEEATQQVQQRHRELTREMVEEAKRRGVGLALTEAGVIATPLGPDGQPMRPEALQELTEQESERLREQQHALQDFISQRVSELRQLEREAARVRERVNKEVADYAVQPLFAELRETYEDQPSVLGYLEAVRNDVLGNLHLFLGGGGHSGSQSVMEMLGGGGPSQEDLQLRYEVNVFVDNAGAHGAPVVFESTPLFFNVFGKVDHVWRMGAMTTDHMQIQPGSLHRANGGFLVFQAKDLLSSPYVWQVLKQSLQSKQARIERLTEQIAVVATSTLEPEPVPLDVKIILVGNPSLARLLQLYDEDYHKLFKVKADFGQELRLNQETIRGYAGFIASRVQEERLEHFDASGVARLIEQSSRMVEDQERLTARFADVADIITEASYWAVQEGHADVTGHDVLRAVGERRHRSNLIEERLQELYDDGTLRVEVEGEEVGQINGLAVIDMGDYSFGRPSRLTASVALGRGELANVEQASQMSGRIHSKGFHILTGYLMSTFGSEATLPIRASIAFEQTYEEIDGDSASSTELYALLSRISGVPISQGIAVTGSVDQQGQVQAIGGATRKVEGFFEVCKGKGLTGEQGVMIPASNVRNLVLRQDVVDAVADGKFHIYAANTIEEGIELLTGIPAGEADADGNYPDGTVFARVSESLRDMAERLRSPERVERVQPEEKPVATEEEGRERDPREGPGQPPEPPPA